MSYIFTQLIERVEKIHKEVQERNSKFSHLIGAEREAIWIVYDGHLYYLNNVSLKDYGEQQEFEIVSSSAIIFKKERNDKYYTYEQGHQKTFNSWISEETINEERERYLTLQEAEAILLQVILHDTKTINVQITKIVEDDDLQLYMYVEAPVK